MDKQQQIYNLLQQNAGNRLTAELINGIAARIKMILEQQEKENGES